MKKIADFPESLQAPPEESPPSAEAPPKEEKKEFPPKEEKKESPPGEEGAVPSEEVAAGSPENPLSQFSREDLEAALLQLLTILKSGTGEMGMPEGAPEGVPPEVAPQEGMPPEMQGVPPEAAMPPPPPPGGQPGLPPEMARTAGLLLPATGAALGAYAAPEGRGWEGAALGGVLGTVGGTNLGRLEQTLTGRRNIGGALGSISGGILGGKLIPAKSPESVPSASFEDGTQLTPEQYQALLQQYSSEQSPTKVAFPLGAALSSLGARAAANPITTTAIAGGAIGGLTAPEGQGWRNAAIGAAGGGMLGHFGGKMLAGAKPGAATQAATHTPPVPQTAPTGEFASLVAKDAVPGGRLTDPRSATEHVQQLIAEGLPGVRTAAVQDLLQRVREAGTNKVASYMYDRQEIDIADAARILGVKLAYLTLKRKRIEQGIEAYSKVNAG